MTGIAERAALLLAQQGETVSVSFPGTPAFDPVTGDAQAPTSATTVTGKGYPSQYRQSELGAGNQNDQTTIQSGDIRLTLENITPRPQVNCSATVDSKTYRVMDVRPIRKAGADVIYILQLRAN